MSVIVPQKKNTRLSVEVEPTIRKKAKRAEVEPSLKLDEENVLKIRRLHEKGWTLRRIAKKFSISSTTVYKVAKRQIWKSV